MSRKVGLLVGFLFLLFPAAATADFQPGDQVIVQSADGYNGRQATVVVVEPSRTLVDINESDSTGNLRRYSSGQLSLVPVPSPTPTVTPSPTPTSIPPSPTPTSTPSPSPTPTPTPTPTPSPTGFPDASNTGVPPGTTLTAYTGPSAISTNGTVIDGKTTGCLQIGALNVTIKNSIVRCAGGIAIYLNDKASASLTVVDSELDCQATNGTALSEARFTVLRADIHGCENGLDMNQQIDVRDSYIHDLYTGGGAHTDGGQMGCGHWDPATSTSGCGGYAPGAKDITFVHNTIFSVSPQGALGTSTIISNRTPTADENVLIQGNLLAGGAYTLYCDQEGQTGINYRVLDNAFSKRFSPNYGAYGRSVDCANETQSGNYDAETGQPLFLP